MKQQRNQQDIFAKHPADAYYYMLMLASKLLSLNRLQTSLVCVRLIAVFIFHSSAHRI